MVHQLIKKNEQLYIVSYLWLHLFCPARAPAQQNSAANIINTGHKLKWNLYEIDTTV